MNNINLIPERIKILEKEKRKKRKVILVLSISILIFMSATYWCLYYLHYIDGKNNIIEKEISELYYIAEQESNIEKLRKSIQYKNSIIEDISKNQKSWKSIFTSISSEVPYGVYISSMDGNSNNINLKCQAFNQESIGEFIINLSDSNKFEEVKINQIKFEKEIGKLTFDLLIILK